MKHLQKFVILLYDRTGESTQVDHCRKLLFANGRQLDRIAPTEAALKEHVKCAVYQAGYCWGQTLIAIHELPSPEERGWKKSRDNHWIPFWTSRPEAAKVCKEMVKCGCKKHVGGHANACLFHFHAQSSASAREPVINKNVLDTFHCACRYIHVLELFNVKSILCPGLSRN